MNKTLIFSITILMLLLSGASLIAQDQYKIVLNDGTKVVGIIKNTEFPIAAEFAELTVQAKYLHSFKNGRFNFTDGSVIMGKFMPCTLEVDASLGALSLDISKVESIAPACYLKENFDNAQLDRTIWNNPPVALAVKNGMLQTTYSNGKVFVATNNKYGNGVYTVCIKSTGDGHTMPNINFMRNENTMDWGWRGYNFHFSLFDKVIVFRKIDGGGNARLWVSPNPELYQPDVMYVVQISFNNGQIEGKISRQSDGAVLETFSIEDSTYTRGYFALRGEAYSPSAAYWDDICITQTD